MKKIYYLLAASLMTTAMVGCSEDTYELGGEGSVKLRATINSDVKVVSRFATEQELSEKCNIWISSDKGLVRKYVGIDNIPAEGIKLLAGHYVAEAWTGDSVPASFDDKYYKGYQPFDVESGTVSQVDLVCKVANVVVSVDYIEEVDNVLTDYTMTVGHSRGQLTFEGRDTRKGYYMMPSTDTDLTFTITGTKNDGSTYTQTGTIPNVAPTTEYRLTVKCKTDDTAIGGALLTIEIDATEIDVEDEITIATAPQFVGYGFDVTQPVYGEQGAFERRSVWIMASSALTSMIIESDQLTALVGGNAMDVLNATDAKKQQLKDGGITILYSYDDINDVSSMKVSYETSLLNSLANADDPYTFVMTATDANGKTSTATLTVSVSDAKMMPVEVAANAVTTWATSATIYGTILKDVTNPAFEYRVQGVGDWTRVAAQQVATRAESTSIYAIISGLQPGTTYEYRTVADGFVGNATATVTTEAASQLENAGFEDWNTSSKAYLIAASSASLYWDSGNHGSSTMNKNVTTPETSIKHGGSYSAKLQSQFVGIGSIGKFAAGNAFVGKYLATDGMDGVLGWGRPFTSRPTKLRGWVKYTPATVGYTASGAPDIVSGQPDKGIIYVAILDGTIQTYNGESFPVIVKTKTAELFDPEGDNVIAYGAKVFDTATTGGGMVEFEIPLDYVRTDTKASYIMVVCSASKGGDYFAGGAGSVMYIDDFELVY